MDIRLQPRAVWLNDSSEVTGLLYTDGTDLKLTGTFYGTQAASTVKTTCNPSSMELFNKAVHLGLGNAIPKWVGYSEYQQFGASAKTTILYEDAEVTTGEIFEPLSKVVTDGTYIYGVKDGGSAIYKFNLSTKSYVAKSDYLFHYTISIAIDGSYIWILHKRGGTFYLSKFSSDLIVIFESALSVTLDIDTVLSDIECTTDYIWIATYLDADSGNSKKLYRCTELTDNSTKTLSDATPSDDIGGSPGYWSDGWHISPPEWKYPRKSLIKITADTVGLAFILDSKGKLNNADNIAVDVDGGLFRVHDDYSGGLYDGISLEIFGIAPSLLPSRYNLRIAYNPANVRLYLIDRNSTDKGIYSHGAFGNGVFNKTQYMVRDLNDTTTTLVDPVPLPINSTGSQVEMHIFSEYSSHWVYKLNSAIGTWGTETNAIKSGIELTFRDNGVVSGGLVNTKRYYYAINYVFDNIQQSPLSNTYRVPLTPSNNQIEVTIKLRDITGPELNKKRITAVNLFRAEGLPDGLVKDSLFRFVQKFDIEQAYPLINSEYYQLICIDDGQVGPTFEAMAEYSETIKSTMVKHTYSTQLGGYRYIAKCYKDELPDAEHIIFRSKLYSFDTFDWTTDLLRCPYVPKAIKGFNNRLFVFFENLIWRVNPDLQPEEDYQGIGIFDNLEPLVTDEGMYWMDKNGIYFHNGSIITDISVPIKTSYSSSYKSYTDTIAAGTQRCIAYSPEKKCVLFSSLNSGTGNIWVWHTESKQWFFWEYGTVTSFYMFNGYKGEIFISTTGNFRQLFNGSTYESAEFVTKKYDAGTSKQKKKWYKVKSRTSGTVSTTYAYDDSTSFSSFTESLNNLSAYNLQLKFSMTGDSYIDSAEIILRQMRGYR